MAILALSPRKDAERLRELRRVIKGELIKVRSAQYQDKLPARHQLKLDQPALKSLKRLADSDDALKTLARLENWCKRKGRGSCWHAIVMACVEADRLRRQFSKHIEEANKIFESSKPLHAALDLLRGFLDQNKNKDWAVLRGKSAAIESGLDLLDYGIDTEESVAEETFAQIGATRKKRIKTAPRDAAIWALTEAVKRHTGKPHYGEVTNLASVMFEAAIDESTVKHAVRKRRPRFDAMQIKRAERLLDGGLTGPDFEHIRRDRN